MTIKRSIVADKSDSTTSNEPGVEARPIKSVVESRIEMSQLMRPQHANFAGNVHGGTILALMDEVAYTCASRFAESYCVTVSVDSVEFLAPVRVGDVVRLKASVILAGNTSMEVGISMIAEDPRHPGSGRRTNRCFLSMVAIGDDGRPTQVPQLRLETAEDRTWNCEAKLRRQLRRRYKSDLAAGVCELDPDDA
ncbi:MAG: acyl-CoA thioesterase [Gemmatimonadales bacterium]